MAASSTISTSRAGLALTAAVALAVALLVAQSRPEQQADATASVGSAATAPDSRGVSRKLAETVKTWTIVYRSHTGASRRATVVLPEWYGPGHNPPLPVIVSPHGRGATGSSNAEFFGRLPAVGRFAVISPDGMGERLKNFSYGAPGQIDDLARMPELATAALPCCGSTAAVSTRSAAAWAGQETLLLVARHPELLAGAAALDSVTDLARRHSQLPDLPCSSACVARWGISYGTVLQSTLSREVGGSPLDVLGAYAARSGLHHAHAISRSRVPLQIWWSTEDRIVSDQQHQSQALFDRLLDLDGCAPVSPYVGEWAHSKEMRASALLPIALSGFRLLPRNAKALPASVRHVPMPRCADDEGTL